MAPLKIEWWEKLLPNVAVKETKQEEQLDFEARQEEQLENLRIAIRADEAGEVERQRHERIKRFRTYGPTQHYDEVPFRFATSVNIKVKEEALENNDWARVGRNAMSCRRGGVVSDGLRYRKEAPVYFPARKTQKIAKSRKTWSTWTQAENKILREIHDKHKGTYRMWMLIFEETRVSLPNHGYNDIRQQAKKLDLGWARR